MRVVVCGRRAYRNRGKVEAVLDALYRRLGRALTVIHADTFDGPSWFARCWAATRHADTVEVCCADRSARQQAHALLTAGPQMAVIFHRGPTGTWLRTLCKAREIPVFEPDTHPTDYDALTQEAVRQLKDWCKAAMTAPFADLPARKQASLLDRTKRAVIAATAELDGQHALKIGMAIYYLMEELAQRDILWVNEGSDIAKAMTLLIDCMGHGFAQEKLDASAQKRAVRVLRAFQAAGYYQERPARAAAE